LYKFVVGKSMSHSTVVRHHAVYFVHVNVYILRDKIRNVFSRIFLYHLVNKQYPFLSAFLYFPTSLSAFRLAFLSANSSPLLHLCYFFFLLSFLSPAPFPHLFGVSIELFHNGDTHFSNMIFYFLLQQERRIRQR
jgi:hypothetical protein